MGSDNEYEMRGFWDVPPKVGIGFSDVEVFEILKDNSGFKDWRRQITEMDFTHRYRWVGEKLSEEELDEFRKFNLKKDKDEE
jgi:hypothetical protein